MKASTIFSTVALFLAASVSAQTACNSVASAIPSCGVPCIESAASSYGCTGSQYKCRCAHASAIESDATNCVISACGSIPEAISVRDAASSVCSCAATAAPDSRRAAFKY